MRNHVDLVRAGEAPTAARLELLLRHHVTVVAQLDDITQSLTAIDHKIDLYKEQSK